MACASNSNEFVGARRSTSELPKQNNTHDSTRPSTHSPPSHSPQRTHLRRAFSTVTSVAPSAPWHRWVRRAFRYLAQSAPSRRQLRRALSHFACHLRRALPLRKQ
ncbi:hypothetical protein HN51_024600 [Arachis hypogaea]